MQQLKRSEPIAFVKLQKLLSELIIHPTTGTGRPKPLKHDLSGLYSRRITQKHRLVYKINETEINILIVSASGHYTDK